MPYKSIVTTKWIRVFETNGVWLGIPLLLLMENAGKAVADIVDAKLGGSRDKKIVVFTGKGGNAGDGLVAARHLLSRGADVTILMLYDKREIEHPDTLLNLGIIERIAETGSRNLAIIKPRSPLDIEAVESDAVIDAMLGVGIKGRLREPLATAIKRFNESKGLKVAIDVPTGMDPDTGKVPGGDAVRADITVTMHYVKPGLIRNDVREYVGELVVAEIGLPETAEKIVGPGDVKYMLPDKPVNAYKGIGGRVLVIGGSKTYTGAPALAGLAALRTGSDLAFIFAPESAAYTIASYSPNLIVIKAGGEEFSAENVDEALSALKTTRAKSMVLGPGLGISNRVKSFVEKIIEMLPLENLNGIVIDADALKHLSSMEVDLKGKAVLTPHIRELAMLLGVNGVPEDLDGRTRYAVAASKKYNAVILLKGVVDIICWKEKCRFNYTGNRGMSTGGTGDVLAGITAAVLARGVEPYEAACIAAFINGVAGDKAYKDYGERITALDLIDNIPKAINEFKR